MKTVPNKKAQKAATKLFCGHCNKHLGWAAVRDIDDWVGIHELNDVYFLCDDCYSYNQKK